MAAGALVGGIAGIGQGKRAQKLEKDYLAAEKNVNPIDPNEVAYLNKVRQQERAFRAGSDPSSAFAAMNARNVGAQTMSNISRAGGPGVVGNLLRAQAGTNQAIAGIGANAAAGANQMLNMQGGLVSRMADKVYQRQVELRNQALERSVSARQNLQNTFQGALAMVPGIAGGISKMGGMNPFAKAAPAAGSAQFGGGLVGNKYMPSVQAGIGYQGLPTGGPPAPNFGLPRTAATPLDGYGQMQNRVSQNWTPGTYRFANQVEADGIMGIR
jgi:hypothetical protein